MKPTTSHQQRLQQQNALIASTLSQLPSIEETAPEELPTAAIDDANLQAAGNALQTFNQTQGLQSALQSPSQFSGNPLAAYQQLPQSNQASLFGFNAPITQHFGNRSGVEVFSGGVNTGTDFGIPSGTPLNLPKGNWSVLDSYAGSGRPGYIGNNDNRGYGNSLLVRNNDSGETLRLSHLSKVGLQKGQQFKGGTVALSGSTGNATGPHLDLEYYDKQGRLANVMQSAYAKYVLGK